jgi:hypothetical protein
MPNGSPQKQESKKGTMRLGTDEEPAREQAD